MRKIYILFTFLFSFLSIDAQSYELDIIPVSIEGLGGLQSYAVGTYDGEWLLVGGRLDGLHRRQPWAAFSADGKNQDLIVVDPVSKTVWRAPLATLPTNIKEQLSSTNMQFYKSGHSLLCTGGYGYSPTADEHITFPYLTIIDLPSTIEAVKNNALNASSFTQIEDEAFRMTGGGLNKIDDTYFLVGGHKFMGRYNPIGPNHGPGFEQVYSNEARRFKINYGVDTTVIILDSYHDEMHLHRRDYNLVPYLSDGDRELMVYSGVFQSTSDLPWLYPVSISKEGHEAHEDFNQYYNHYHCAYLPIYDSASEEMRTLFFGGIAQFYEEDGWMVQNNDVPFVNTIAELSRNNSGFMQENIMEETMPGLLGAGSVFILNDEILLADDDIMDGSTIGDNFQVIGHIYGGIRSSLPNIFWINTGSESEASSTIYQVSIRKKTSLNSSNLTTNEEALLFYPNPAQKLLRMSITLGKPMDLSISITDFLGKQINQIKIDKTKTKEGDNLFALDNVNIEYGAFFYTVKVGDKVLSRKVIWTE